MSDEQDYAREMFIIKDIGIKVLDDLGYKIHMFSITNPEDTVVGRYDEIKDPPISVVYFSRETAGAPRLMAAARRFRDILDENNIPYGEETPRKEAAKELITLSKKLQQAALDVLG